MNARLRNACLALLSWTFCVGFTCDFQSLTILPEKLPNGVVDRQYAVSLTAGGSNDGIWSLNSGQLPDGLEFIGATGSISGKPTEAGTFNFTVSVTRLFSGSGQRSYSLTVNPKLVVDFDLPVARQDQAYAYTIGVSGGVPPYSFEVLGLPAGLQANLSTGQISGTPVEPEEGRTIQVTVTDDAGQAVTATDSLLIKPRAVQIITDTLPPGKVNLMYSSTIQIVDGKSPFTFSVMEGTSLPPGLALPDNQASGVISGVPTMAGMFTFTIVVEDSDNPATTDSREFTLTIAPE